MASSLSESRIDHRGDPLPDGVYAVIERDGAVVSYKARWRERDANGVWRQRSKSFSRRDAGSLDGARAAAVAHRDGALEIVRAGDSVLRADRTAGIVLGDLFKEWITHHAAPNTGERYARSGPHLGQAHRAAARPGEARRPRRRPGHHRALSGGPPAGPPCQLRPPRVPRAPSRRAALGTAALPASAQRRRVGSVPGPERQAPAPDPRRRPGRRRADHRGRPQPPAPRPPRPGP